MPQAPRARRRAAGLRRHPEPQAHADQLRRLHSLDGLVGRVAVARLGADAARLPRAHDAAHVRLGAPLLARFGGATSILDAFCDAYGLSADTGFPVESAFLLKRPKRSLLVIASAPLSEQL